MGQREEGMREILHHKLFDFYFSQQWLLDRQDILHERQADLKDRGDGKESKGGGENY